MYFEVRKPCRFNRDPCVCAFTSHVSTLPFLEGNEVKHQSPPPCKLGSLNALKSEHLEQQQGHYKTLGFIPSET